MKKWVWIFVAMMAVMLALCACETTGETEKIEPDEKIEETVGEDISASDESDNRYHEHQELTATEFELDPNTMLRIDIPEAGLENIYIRDIIEFIEIDKETYAKVYLFADDRFGGYMSTSNLYLAAEIRDRMIIKDIAKWDNQCSMFSEMDSCDIDGDGDEEIVLQEGIDLTGGAGQYLSRILIFQMVILRRFSHRSYPMISMILIRASGPKYCPEESFESSMNSQAMMKFSRANGTIRMRHMKHGGMMKKVIRRSVN